MGTSCQIPKTGSCYANLHEIYNFIPLVTTDEHIVLSKNTADTFQKEYVGRKTNAQRKLAEAKLDLKKEQNNYSKYQILQRDDLDAYNKHHKGKLEEQQQIVTAKEATLAQAETELERISRALPT